ncbi:SCP-like extracellular protein [Colletotrichum orchidophilum]|uniref:SCP-like extracellular protein n=1 Tax=Colletotrichum orchidophilum TaxID=1209926 RepID=A0A1G4ATG1_9PEZI|nr:SCP-like extracellular protein [Colletotrichum orchidophilum]OHE92395.1 SCP-like extracellular protein [Colletotrichum orchidophilum]
MFSSGKTLLTAAVVGLTVIGFVHAAPHIDSGDENRALSMLNTARSEAGVPALIWDNNLKEGADIWAIEIAKVGYIHRSPAHQRDGAGELLAHFKALEMSSVLVTNPLISAVKLWLSFKDMDNFKTTVENYYETLGITEQILSDKATHIGCATRLGFADSGARDPLSSFTVCRVFKEVKPTTIIARQDLSPGPFQGDITFFNPALGACGWTDNDDSMIVALSHIKMGSQSNGNPLCGKTVRIEAEGKSVNVKVTDKCMGCAVNDIDVSPTVFKALFGDLGRGRVTGVTWTLV